MYAVTIEPIPSIFFLAESPRGEFWEAIKKMTPVEVEEGVEIDIPVNATLWPEGADPPEQVLCRATSDPKRFKIFKYNREVNRDEFIPTGRNFAGIYSMKTWERFIRGVPGWVESLKIPDTDPPEVLEEAIREIREGR